MVEKSAISTSLLCGINTKKNIFIIITLEIKMIAFILSPQTMNLFSSKFSLILKKNKCFKSYAPKALSTTPLKEFIHERKQVILSTFQQ